jgi:ABC-type dipeptide/oligopeptide/nickel transport system ATPase component
VAVMEKGVFAECAHCEELFADPRSDYARRLLAAVPRI